MTEKDIGANKILLAVPVLVLVIASGMLIHNFTRTGEWFERSIELKGGTLLSVNTGSTHDVGLIEDALSQDFGRVVVREIRSFSGSGLTVQADAGIDIDQLKENLESMGIDTSDASVETMGSSLGESFWYQAQVSIVIAFIIMGITVFVIFRTFVPSAAVMAAAISDIVVTLGLMQVFSIELSLASFAALLMLIGYSIDTDILLTTRTIRNTEGDIRERMYGAFKTGMTMTLTTMAVLVAVIITTTSPVLLAITSVLFLGLLIDIINTWFMNATILRMYAEKKGL
jgi:preprotein translocase subunit SecF